MTSRPTDEQLTWFRTFTPVHRPRARLFCFPYAGGSASVFSTWGAALPPDVELVAVQYPGRQDRIGEPAVDDLTVLADRVTETMAGLCGVPVSLFGHSMGAWLAYEVVLRLENRWSCTVENLFVSGQTAPHLDHTITWDTESDEALVAEIQRMGGSGSSHLDHPELRELILPFLRADFRAVNTYRRVPVIRTQTPVVAYCGDRDPDITEDDLQAWSRATTTGFATALFPGDHFYIEESEKALLEDLSARLRRA
jgi:pyochelin biosynthetic protein PchC